MKFLLNTFESLLCQLHYSTNKVTSASKVFSVPCQLPRLSRSHIVYEKSTNICRDYNPLTMQGLLKLWMVQLNKKSEIVLLVLFILLLGIFKLKQHLLKLLVICHFFCCCCFLLIFENSNQINCFKLLQIASD